MLSVVDGFVTANYKAVVSAAKDDPLQLSYRKNYSIIHKDMLEFECKNSIILSSHLLTPHLPTKTDTDAIYEAVDPMGRVFKRSCGESIASSQHRRIDGYALERTDVDLAVVGMDDQLHTMEGRVDDQLHTIEGADDQLQAIEGADDQLHTMEGADDQLQVIKGTDEVQRIESWNDEQHTMKGSDDQLHTIEGRIDQLHTMEGADDQLHTIEGADDQLRAVEGADDQLQAIEGSDDQLQTIEGADDQLQAIEGADQLQAIKGADEVQRIEGWNDELHTMEERADELQTIEGTDQLSIIEASGTDIRSYIDVTSGAKRKLPSWMRFDPTEEVVCMDAVYLSIECGLRLIHNNEVSVSDNSHHINGRRSSIIGLNGMKSKILFHPLSLNNKENGATNNPNYSPQSSRSAVHDRDNTPTDRIQMKPYSFRNVVFEQYEADLLMEQGDDTIHSFVRYRIDLLINFICLLLYLS